MKLGDALEKFLRRRMWQIIIFYIGFLLLSIALFLVNVVVSSTQTLQSLIQADATVLGFFGVIAAYSLSSFDSRIDRFEQQRFDLNQKGHNDYAEEIFKRIVFTRIRKRQTAQGVAYVSGFLILSLVLGMIVLSANDTKSILVWIFAFGALSFFFLGLIMIFFFFYELSWEAGKVE